MISEFEALPLVHIMSLFKFGFTKSHNSDTVRVQLERDSISDTSLSFSQTQHREGSEPTTQFSASSERDSNFDNDAAGFQSSKKRNLREKKANRKYDPSYLKYGFISVGSENLPMCLVCKSQLTNDSMKPSNLLRHLMINHQHLQNKPIEYFDRLKSELKIQSRSITGFVRT